MELGTRLKHAWNAFRNRDPTSTYYQSTGPSSSYQPYRARYSRGNERTIFTSVCNRIANDVASIDIMHVNTDEDGRFLSVRDSSLNSCLTLEANKDQTARAFKLDIVESMFNEGYLAVVPVDTTINPKESASFSIETMRTGKITDWYPDKVKINLYNDQTGRHEDIIMLKRNVAIIENPFYSIMNEPNSTLKRLVRKLALLDGIDEQTSAGKLDLIIQLPHVIRGELRKQQAEERRKNVEMQLAGSKYGVAYIDGTERIVQLNRPLENNLLKQIEYLSTTFLSQLGFHQSILDGTADEKTMLNYHNRIIEPILAVIVSEFRRKFLSKTARSQHQDIQYFKDPFKLTPVEELAKVADTMTRNEIMTKNEFRQRMGMKPSNDPKADQLVNSNIAQPADKTAPPASTPNNEAQNPTKDTVQRLLQKVGGETFGKRE